MPIDFSAEANRRSYSGRAADRSWYAAVQALVEPRGKDVVDLGCGGGTYTRAWRDLGAATVTGVDSSAAILRSAREEHGGAPGIDFRHAEATATGLPAECADVVFARALVHHLSDMQGLALEAARLLRPGGVVLVQDRTPEDVARPGSPSHPRGWFFEVHPRLVEVENARRPTDDAVSAALTAAGLGPVTTTTLDEVRRRHPDREQYLAEIAARTGRSILHELDDEELSVLVEGLRRRLPDGAVTEADRWTIWRAERSD